MKPTKVIVTIEKSLRAKYGKNFSRIDRVLKALVKSDAAKDIVTTLVYVDNMKSSRKAGVTSIKGITPQTCKAIIDKLYNKHFFDYITIVGAQDVFPFQPIANPVEDDDTVVESDLPYACESPYSTDVTNFTGPTRVVSRIPDVPYHDDPRYLEKVINAIINHKAQKASALSRYFSVSTKAWQKSTQQSLSSIFNDHSKLLLSPDAAPKKGYSARQLKPLIHFYNCHGAKGDSRFFGQDGEQFPLALDSRNLGKHISFGTVVAAECCYGAELIDPATIDATTQSVSNTYLGNDAIAFMGSSTISYGPEDSQGLADLLTQDFIKNVIRGVSTGRALLEARQSFLSINGPELDPYELKTMAQFYLLGDSSLHVAVRQEDISAKLSVGNTVKNDRERLSTRGKNLKQNIALTCKEANARSIKRSRQVSALLKKTKFNQAAQTAVYSVKHHAEYSGIQKAVRGQQTKFHTFIKTSPPVATSSHSHAKSFRIQRNKVLVVKESEQQILGWRIYVAR